MTCKQSFIPAVTPDIETGCYIDGHFGIYGIELLFDLVIDLVDPDDLPDDIDDIGTVIRHSLYGDHGSRVSAFGYHEFDVDGTRTGHGITVDGCREYIGDFYDELTDRLPRDTDHIWMWIDGELFYETTETIDDIWDLS